MVGRRQVFDPLRIGGPADRVQVLQPGDREAAFQGGQDVAKTARAEVIEAIAAEGLAEATPLRVAPGPRLEEAPATISRAPKTT